MQLETTRQLISEFDATFISPVGQKLTQDYKKGITTKAQFQSDHNARKDCVGPKNKHHESRSTEVFSEPNSETTPTWSRSNPNRETPYASEISGAVQYFGTMENDRSQTLLQVWDDLHENELGSESKNSARENWKTYLADWEADRQSVSSESKNGFASLTLT